MAIGRERGAREGTGPARSLKVRSELRAPGSHMASIGAVPGLTWAWALHPNAKQGNKPERSMCGDRRRAWRSVQRCQQALGANAKPYASVGFGS